MKLVTELGINPQARDLQRAHCLGKKKVSGAAKPCPIIVCFMSYKTRREFMFAKARVATSWKSPGKSWIFFAVLESP